MKEKNLYKSKLRLNFFNKINIIGSKKIKSFKNLFKLIKKLRIKAIIEAKIIPISPTS